MTSELRNDERVSPCAVVGIGASAGGLAALEQFFTNVPADSGMAFVVVQHLSPDFKSLMNELLARCTSLPVVLVEDGMVIAPDCVYLIPPKKEMIVSGGHLLLSDKDVSQEMSLPIDIFFRSLAQDVGDRATGIVLSGAGSDGSRGIRDIHEAGGLVLCQDPESAQFDGMPRSARDTGLVDHVLTPAAMPRLLVDLSRRPTELPELQLVKQPLGMNDLFRILQDEYGIDFSHYKPNTVLRRIDRRLQLSHVENVASYLTRLGSDPTELDALYRDLLIGVTRFFRDEDVYQKLADEVLPELLSQVPPGDEFRAWVAGCATGEEAYSIGILLHEQLQRMGREPRFKIFATDVHRGSLDFAARGLYLPDGVAHIGAERLARFFSKQGNQYQVRPDLRQQIVFARHNVVRDAPFTRLDLVSCRNLLIYLQPLAQKKVLSLLHFALKRKGVLLLGPSETLAGLADEFETIDSHWRLYRKQRDARIPPPVHASDRRARGPSLATSGESSRLTYSATQIMGVYDALLDEHMPPSLLLNDRRELVHAFGGAGRHLKVRNGRPSLDVLDLVEPEMKMALTGALQRALKERGAVVYRNLRLPLDGTEMLCKLTVKPVVARGAVPAHLLVTLEPSEAVSTVDGEETEVDVGEASREHVGLLETELRYTRENLQATIEELETSNEELQATNEELIASNEELQGTNEELQSVNEELFTVNAEYQKKIAQLTELTNDIDNLLSSIEVATVFLDRELCIRKFTPRMSELFNLLPQDIGRPIRGFSSSLDDPDLLEDLERVLESEKPVEREVRDRVGNWFFLRILPYRAKGSVDGVVLTLIDLNAVKLAEDALFRERHLLESLLGSTPDCIYFQDAKGRLLRVNPAMARRLGIGEPAEALQKSLLELLPEHEAPKLVAADRRVLEGHSELSNLEEHSVAAGDSRWFATTRLPLRDREGKTVGMFGVWRDVTDQKRAQDQVRSAVTRRDQFLAVLSHELRNPLGAITNANALLRQRSTGADDVLDKAIDVIERQSRQMSLLLDDLLEVSRVTRNKIELRPQVIDARAAASEAIEALRDRFAEKQIEVRVKQPESPVRLCADPARLQQILSNLLGNAAKYSKSGGLVEVEIAELDGQGVLTVRDDGAGIAPDMLEAIFDLFVQERASLARSDGGMGVGLTLVRALVELHGGSVQASSAGRDAGCEFVVRLPLAPSQAVSPRKRTPRTSWPRASTIVIVEDNADSRETLRVLLEGSGYEVHTAESGEEGAAVIARVRPQIAIVDIGLPEMNGYEVARRIRDVPELEGVFLVALTGYGQPADRRAAAESGFDEHLVKPLGAEDLAKLMGRDTGRETPVNELSNLDEPDRVTS